MLLIPLPLTNTTLHMLILLTTKISALVQHNTQKPLWTKKLLKIQTVSLANLSLRSHQRENGPNTASPTGHTDRGAQHASWVDPKITHINVIKLVPATFLSSQLITDFSLMRKVYSPCPL